jgi:hypothetical protein
MDEVTQTLYDDETLQGKQVNWQILLGSNMLCSVEDFKNAEFRQASFLKIAEEPIWASDLELKDNESEDDFCDIGTYVIKQLLAVGSEEDGNLQLPYIGKVFRFYSRYWWEH